MVWLLVRVIAHQMVFTEKLSGKVIGSDLSKTFGHCQVRLTSSDFTKEDQRYQEF